MIMNMNNQYVCRCGSILKSSNKSSITKHERTKKHIKFISKISESKPDYSISYKTRILSEDEINWEFLSRNKNPIAIDLLEKNQDKIDWYWLSGNPSAIHILEKNKDKIVWEHLLTNPNAMEIIENNKEKFQWDDSLTWNNLSRNPSAIHILEENLDKLDPIWFSMNENLNNLLIPSREVLSWQFLSRNPSAIEILEENQDKIDWKRLSANPKALNLLKSNPDKIDWDFFAENPLLFHDDFQELLKQNEDKLSKKYLSENPNLFVYDYEKMKNNCNIFKEELIAYVFHPSRIFRNVTDETDIDEILDMYD